MLKRFIFYSLIFVVICGFTYRIYDQSKPQTVITVIEPINYNISPYYTSEDIDEYIIKAEKSVNVLFYDSQDLNSVYVFNSILTRIKADYGVTDFANLVYCDFTDYQASQITTTKNHWGFYDTPALINLSLEGRIIKVNSALEWTESNPLTYKSVENWLINNKIIEAKD